MKGLKEIDYRIAKAKSQRDIDRIHGYAKALYDYDHITYEELEHIRRRLNQLDAELVK